MVDFKDDAIPDDFYWFNEPPQYQLGRGLEITTSEETDFWQNTHYGFQRDNGHCLLKKVKGDFTLLTHVEYEPRNQYDQCGLMIRIDQNNWIKVSTEYEDEKLSRLGSVVTNLGYSDWATQDVSSGRRDTWYKITRQKSDYMIHYSYDGRFWNQMRIAHLHLDQEEVQAGIYACSPIGGNFKCRFTTIGLEQ